MPILNVACRPSPWQDGGPTPNPCKDVVPQVRRGCLVGNCPWKSVALPCRVEQMLTNRAPKKRWRTCYSVFGGRLSSLFCWKNADQLGQRGEGACGASYKNRNRQPHADRTPTSTIQPNRPDQGE